MLPPRPIFTGGVPPSFVAPARRCQAPLAPCADVHSTSWRLRKSFRRQTRTLCESARKAPPLFSNPTSSSAQAVAQINGTRLSRGGWARLNFRTGPIQNTGIMSDCIALRHPTNLSFSNRVHRLCRGTKQILAINTTRLILLVLAVSISRPTSIPTATVHRLPKSCPIHILTSNGSPALPPRKREIALRVALGARRGRVIGMMLKESLIRIF